MTFTVVCFTSAKASTDPTLLEPLHQAKNRVRFNKVPLITPSPSLWLWFRWMVDEDSGNLGNPFMRVTGVVSWSRGVDVRASEDHDGRHGRVQPRLRGSLQRRSGVRSSGHSRSSDECQIDRVDQG